MSSTIAVSISVLNGNFFTTGLAKSLLTQLMVMGFLQHYATMSLHELFPPLLIRLDSFSKVLKVQDQMITSHWKWFHCFHLRIEPKYFRAVVSALLWSTVFGRLSASFCKSGSCSSSNNGHTPCGRISVMSNNHTHTNSLLSRCFHYPSYPSGVLSNHAFFCIYLLQPAIHTNYR